MLRRATFQSCPSTLLMKMLMLMSRALLQQMQPVMLGQQQLLALVGRAHWVQLLVVAGAEAEAGRRPLLFQERPGVAGMDQQDAEVAAGAGARGEEGPQHCKQKRSRRMRTWALLMLTWLS
jgi:hypothetical protein